MMMARMLFGASAFFFASLRFGSAFSPSVPASTNNVRDKTGFMSFPLYFSMTTGSNNNFGPPNQNINHLSSRDDQIRDMICDMTRFFVNMVDPYSNRFFQICFPETGEQCFQQVPLRDLGSTWDASTALLYWKQPSKQQYLEQNPAALTKYTLEKLELAVDSTFEAYASACVGIEPSDPFFSRGSCISSKVLGQPTTIAHSGFLLLIASNRLRLGVQGKEAPPQFNAESLVRGILSMQRFSSDGAFGIRFDESPLDDDNVHKDVEFAAGEAMTALMDIYELDERFDVPVLSEETRQSILTAMSKAIEFYSKLFYEDKVDVNYCIWQIQAFGRFHEALVNQEQVQSTNSSLIDSEEVAKYVLDMCMDLVRSQSWKQLAMGKRVYATLETVEIACGLDALAQGLRVAESSSNFGEELQARMLRLNAGNAIDYLQFIQDLIPEDQAVGKGGLGYGGLQVKEQRLDVTGHALSALVKLSFLNHTV